ncbi:hypothetical protein M427DRAFT_51602 [Gonapodya prolifera JEL478]|uniref:Uncharacterized protein n=1 Tax=Gonapodya prolifera (strain JEL478) TaxID=1344416 RepID=A0A139AXF4_GONPJ|nr:hypothetical protein M427DRAFT_51602 [Gonapodya prolifera JEL478]|eukprot:KXS21384.1 hypothetical protein M427DRAFT_51602 [Gonapodya prolifera JEL478]
MDGLKGSPSSVAQREALKTCRCVDCFLISRQEAPLSEALSKVCSNCHLRLHKREFSSRQWKENEQPRCQDCVELDWSNYVISKLASRTLKLLQLTSDPYAIHDY